MELCRRMTIGHLMNLKHLIATFTNKRKRVLEYLFCEL